MSAKDESPEAEPAFLAGDHAVIRRTGEVCRIAYLVPLLVLGDREVDSEVTAGWLYGVLRPGSADVVECWPESSLAPLGDDALNAAKIARALGRQVPLAT